MSWIDGWRDKKKIFIPGKEVEVTYQSLRDSKVIEYENREYRVTPLERVFFVGLSDLNAS